MTLAPPSVTVAHGEPAPDAGAAPPAAADPATAIRIACDPHAYPGSAPVAEPAQGGSLPRTIAAGADAGIPTGVGVEVGVEARQTDPAVAADRRWMQRALALALAAEAAGEVPVGAVLVRDGQVLGEAGNGPIGAHDPSAHAEIRALRAAGLAAGNYRLPGSTLYVTLEPCPMCAGALVHARVERVVYAAADPRTGAAGSVYDLLRDPRLNHRCRVDSGLCADDSAALLRRFFRARRKPAGAPPTDPA